MSIKDISIWLKAKRTIRKVAKIQQITEDEVRSNIQEAIDRAWEDDDPGIQAMQRQLFPHGKPTLEQFITTMADRANEVEMRNKNT